MAQDEEERVILKAAKVECRQRLREASAAAVVAAQRTPESYADPPPPEPEPAATNDWEVEDNDGTIVVELEDQVDDGAVHDLTGTAESASASSARAPEYISVPSQGSAKRMGNGTPPGRAPKRRATTTVRSCKKRKRKGGGLTLGKKGTRAGSSGEDQDDQESAEKQLKDYRETQDDEESIVKQLIDYRETKEGREVSRACYTMCPVGVRRDRVCPARHG